MFEFLQFSLSCLISFGFCCSCILDSGDNNSSVHSCKILYRLGEYYYSILPYIYHEELSSQLILLYTQIFTVKNSKLHSTGLFCQIFSLQNSATLKFSFFTFKNLSVFQSSVYTKADLQTSDVTRFVFMYECWCDKLSSHVLHLITIFFQLSNHYWSHAQMTIMHPCCYYTCKWVDIFIPITSTN